MACLLTHVPAYLHWDGNTIYNDCDFLNEHFLHRLYFPDKSPLEFPAGQSTALSCKWSFLINDSDILIIDPSLGTAYKSAPLNELRAYSRKDYDGNGRYVGWHKLTCKFNHDPLECDFSHSEILIEHKVFNDAIDETSDSLIFSEIYTYRIWNEGQAELNRDNSFYKKLRKNYKLDILKKFSPPQTIEPNQLA